MANEESERYPQFSTSLAIRNLSGVLLVAVGLAAVVGFVTGGFLRVLHWLTVFLWETIPGTIAIFPSHPVYTITICTFGGFVLGVGRRHLGDQPGDVEELLSRIRAGHTVDYDVISKGAANSLVSLAFGATLGPELALIAIGGGLSSRAVARLRATIGTAWSATVAGANASMRSLFVAPSGPTSELSTDSDRPTVPQWWHWIAGLTAILVGAVALKVTAGSSLSFDYTIPSYRSSGSLTRLLTALSLGAVGGLVAVAYLRLRGRLRYQGESENVLVRSTLGGLVLGLVGSVAPPVLFSGQNAIQPLFTGPSLTAGTLFVLGLVKITLVSVMLETGWKGGPIFPLLAGGAAIGAAIGEVVPEVGVLVGLTAVMAGTTTAELNRPLAVAVLVVFLFSASLFVVAAIGAVGGTIVVRVAGERAVVE